MALSDKASAVTNHKCHNHQPFLSIIPHRPLQAGGMSEGFSPTKSLRKRDYLLQGATAAGVLLPRNAEKAQPLHLRDGGCGAAVQIGLHRLHSKRRRRAGEEPRAHEPAPLRHPQPIRRQERFRTVGFLPDQAAHFFDPDFWQDYNIIEPSESLENAIARLRKSK